MSEKTSIISKVSKQGGRKQKLGPVLGKKNGIIYLKNRPYSFSQTYFSNSKGILITNLSEIQIVHYSDPDLLNIEIVTI
jgi:hypothetical protein